MTRILTSLLILLLFSVDGWAEDKALRGVALVIGQSEYTGLPALANPVNDARAIEGLLEDLGFEVTGVTDRDARKLRRDLERFVEDAEGADAAIIYYSGHGIEAGGENWLVPVDADPKSLENVAKNLVPLSSVLDDLRTTVPLTIFLIDACRSNPFPPGMVAREAGKEVPMSGAGLGAPRGFSAIEATATDEIGTIIGFAAEPGLPALDGDPGGNSPYAAAILRHLSALTGNEFGLVMRMVTEEVYLKTDTRQRPWVNESLRKQLYFGQPGETLAGGEGIITGERRTLLLRIASLEEPVRKQVEGIAVSDQVPLDTLYGVLAALGETDMPNDADGLEKALKAQAGRLRQILDEQEALKTDDPELGRLVSLADQALKEGAIKSARSFLDDAKIKVASTKDTIEAVEARLREKRIANAEILAKSGGTAELDFDFAGAVEDYAEAFDWVKDADLTLAAKYKTYEADALQSIGYFRGDNDAMARAIAAYEVALTLADRETNANQWLKASNNLANVYLRIGERELGTAQLTKAVELYRGVLSVDSASHKERATTLSNLGIALNTLGQRTNDAAVYAEAEKVFAEALSIRDRKADPLGWALDMANAANLDVALADRNVDYARFKAAEDKLVQALVYIDPAVNRIEWAQAKNNLAIALRAQGANGRDVNQVRKALGIYEEILPIFDRKTFPLDWGTTNGNIAVALTNVGALEVNIGEFEKAVGYYRQAFEEVTRARAPMFWSKLQNAYGMTLQIIAAMKSDNAMLEEAAKAFRAALEVRTRDVNAELWAESQQLLASTLSSLASAKSDPALSDEAIAAYKAAREVFTRDAFPADWRSASAGLASALQGKGILEQDVAVFKEAESIYKEVLSSTDREAAPLDWAAAMKDIATIQFMLGTTIMDKSLVEQSLASFDQALEVYQVHGGFMDRMMIGSMRNNAAQALELFDK